VSGPRRQRLGTREGEAGGPAGAN